MRPVAALTCVVWLLLPGCGDDTVSVSGEIRLLDLSSRCAIGGEQAWCYRPPGFTDDTPQHRAAVGRADIFADPIPAVDLGPDFRVSALADFGPGGDICALDLRGQVKCWGDTGFDLEGVGDREAFGDEAVEMGEALPSFDFGTQSPVTGIAASQPGWFCAWFEDGRAKCFGKGAFGIPPYDPTVELGLAADERGPSLPFLDLGSGVHIRSMHGSSGSAQMCAVTDRGRVKCWGEDLAVVQLSTGETPHLGDKAEEMGSNLPFLDLGALFVATEVAVGWQHTCALSDTGEVRCWGLHVLNEVETDDILYSGMCGTGNTISHIPWDAEELMGDNLVPVDLGPLKAVSISAGSLHTCALLENGSVKCWGHNDRGQLGQGDTLDRGTSPDQMGESLLPVDLGGSRRATALKCADSHCCVIRDQQDVVCWGQSTGVEPVGDEPGEMGEALVPHFELP